MSNARRLGLLPPRIRKSVYGSWTCEDWLAIGSGLTPSQAYVSWLSSRSYTERQLEAERRA